MKTLLIVLALLPSLCAADQAWGSKSASAQLLFKIVVPPVFKIVQARQVDGGMEYRVWTNVRSIVFQHRAYHFSSVGETLLYVPASKELLVVHGL